MRAVMKVFNEKKKAFRKDSRLEMRVELPDSFHTLNIDTRVRGGEVFITK
jgi:hypothetical protein